MKTRKSSFPILLAAMGLALFADRAPAQFLFSNLSGQNASIIGTNLTAGATFTLGSNPILLTALGVYDNQKNGLAHSYQVGIWSGGALLTSVTVPAGVGATLLDDFRYVGITPVVLAANATYRIGSNLGFNQQLPPDLLAIGGTATLDPAFGFADPRMRSDYNSGFAEPGLTLSHNVWAANLQYTAVPEPGVLALLGCGLVALGGRLRRTG